MTYPRHYCSVELSKEIAVLIDYYFYAMTEQYWHNYVMVDEKFKKVNTFLGYVLHNDSYLDMAIRQQSKDVIQIPDNAKEYPAYTTEELGYLIRTSNPDYKDIVELKNSVMSYDEVNERAKILINILKRKK
ncbi:MAG: hypothetical protein M0R51_17800 [Clostridia bacterium]|jgi:hypothetical protein|nr:hypothetical protein [Clostridia bacterium]